MRSLLSRLGGWDLATAADVVALPSGSDVEQVRAVPAAALAFGINLDAEQVNRRTAMTIPAVRRGRQVIAGTIGACPLRARRWVGSADETDTTDQHRILTTPDPNTTLAYLLTWTVDDLLFHGVAWWLVTDRAPDSEGSWPRSVRRLVPGVDVWEVDPKTRRVLVNGAPVADRDLVRFDGPDEGVLAYGGRTLRTCLLLEEAVRNYARLDVPLGTLTPKDGVEPPSPVAGTAAEWSGIEGDARSQVDYVLDEWEASRRRRSTAYLGGLDYAGQQFDAQQIGLAEARSFQAAEVARLLNLDPHHLNAPTASSMTYTNRVDVRRDLVDVSLVGYLEAIGQRLSMPDVTPRGTVVDVVTDRLLSGDLGDQLAAHGQAVALGAEAPSEVRAHVLRRPPLTAAQQAELAARTPAPAPAPTPED